MEQPLAHYNYGSAGRERGGVVNISMEKYNTKKSSKVKINVKKKMQQTGATS